MVPLWSQDRFITTTLSGRKNRSTYVFSDQIEKIVNELEATGIRINKSRKQVLISKKVDGGLSVQARVCAYVSEDIREAMRRAIAAMPKSHNTEPLRLYSPGPNATKLWREWFPGIEIVEVGEIPTA